MVRSQTSQNFDNLRTIGARLRRFAADIKAGLDALHRAQFDAPWARDHRLTYEDWQDYLAPRPQAEVRRHEAAVTFAARPATH